METSERTTDGASPGRDGRPALRGVPDVAVSARPLRPSGAARQRTLLAVGGFGDVVRLVQGAGDDPRSEWRVTAACTPMGAGPGGAATVHGVPVLGDLDAVARLAATGRFDAVVVMPASGCTVTRFTRLAEKLLGGPTILLADPFLVADGPRVLAAMVVGVPLLRLADTGPTRSRRACRALLSTVGVRRAG